MSEDGGRANGDGLLLHVRGHNGDQKYSPMPVETPEKVEFEVDNFKGEMIFLHRPAWSYDSPETEKSYPFKQLFHGRRRLWEWRIQGRFKRRPGMLYVGIELEDYVPVNFATRSLMRGILPLIQTAIQCKLVHHEVGDPDDPSLRPGVVAPIWSCDNTLVHDDPKDAPDIGASTVPGGLNRKAARQYWETLWNGGGPSWDAGGPTFTFCIWGPSQLLDMRTWVFRKLPMMWGRELKMEPFCGKQPVHAVLYELADGETASRHRQEEKVYCTDLRMMPEVLWEAESAGRERSPMGPPALGIAEKAAAIAEGALQHLPIPDGSSSDGEDFCSVYSGDSSPEKDHLAEAGLLNVDGAKPPPEKSAPAPGEPVVRRPQKRSRLKALIRCCRCRKRSSSARRPSVASGLGEQRAHSHQWEQLPV